MGTRTKRRPAAERAAYKVEEEWTESDRLLLNELLEKEALLPPDAPRALISVRLSVFTEDTTSPVRQELDLRIEALAKGHRVVGVASDLNVSATKVPPWRRKSLGAWLNDRSPEFDVIWFWKLDRFIRNLMDLHVMLTWCQKYGKNLLSKHDVLDLTTTTGKIMITIIGGVAEIEAANTSTRVASLWEYTKTQAEWLVGKPAFGYATADTEDGRVVLAVVPEARRALRYCRRMKLRGRSARFMVKVIQRSGLMSEGLTPSTLLRRLRNPALMGYRVEEDKKGGMRRSKLVLGRDGKPIRVAEAIFTEEEFYELQTVLDSDGINQPPRGDDATHFRGVLKCVTCETNVTVHRSRTKFGEYQYLRCQKCKSGGLGVPNPMEVYAKIVEDVLKVLGDFPVEVREYAKGAEARQEVKRLEESIAYYMKELEPDGRYARTQFTRDQAQSTLDKLISELAAIDPETTEDRWVHVAEGRTFRDRWKSGGMAAMTDDLVRVGIKCVMTRTKVKGVRAPAVHLKLVIPKDVRERLVIREDDFADAF